MAYTYDDFISEANKAGLLSKFSQTDLDTATKYPEYGISILNLTKDAQGAVTEEQKLLATEAINQLRKSYGSLGGQTAVSGVTQTSAAPVTTGSPDAGTGYTSQYATQISELLNKINGYGDFTYDNAEQYQTLLDSIVNREPHSYDLESDPVWSSYKKSYLREGERATADALAKASAGTGGAPSSYAVTAAQQAGNYYAAQLNDIIPTLYENDYQKYLNDFSMKLQSLGALDTDRTFDYQDYLNKYNMLGTSLGNFQNQDNTEYSRYLDTLEQEQQKYTNALALYQTLGYATPEIAAILGIDISADTGGGSTYYGGSGTGYDNQGYGDATVKMAQHWLGVTEDGQWGSQSAAAAAARGYGSIAEVLKAMAGDPVEEATGSDAGGGSGGTSTKNSTTNVSGSGGGLSVDLDSVLQLGYGPISESYLNNLVESGQVEEYVEGNKIKFRKVEQKPKTTSALYGLTQNLKIN